MGSFRLGSILGFEIRIDYSWFVIVLLILWTLSQGVFPVAYPGLARGIYLAMGAAGTVLFFMSLLGHELSHSLVARGKGIPVEGITLFIFGGMARTRMEAESPGDEFVIAGVGPLTSVALGGLFALLAWAGAQAQVSVAWTGVAAYLAEINIALAVFNLLPGFPLDGGRLFRSALWKLTGSLERATRWATNGGIWIGYAIVAFGIFQVFAGNLTGGMWMVFIGWFLRNAAMTSYRQFRLQAVLEDVPARDLMTRAPETVPGDLSLRDLVATRFLRRRFQGYPVTDAAGHAVGIVTLHQVREVPEDEWDRRTVADIMAPADGLLVRPEDSMVTVLERMQASPTRRVLVARDGVVEGIVTPSDVAGWLRREREFKRQSG
ncbi:MAG: site-2 protease family protein [Gemmatimonadetes bacterium]|nr:site-2 protease family protein [Gemmatimonadota bacterium]